MNSATKRKIYRRKSDGKRFTMVDQSESSIFLKSVGNANTLNSEHLVTHFDSLMEKFEPENL